MHMYLATNNAVPVSKWAVTRIPSGWGGDDVYTHTSYVIASCAFGINGNSLNDPQAELRMFLRKIFYFSVANGLAALISFTAPTNKNLLKIKFLDGDTNYYLRKTVWSTGDKHKYCSFILLQDGKLCTNEGCAIFNYVEIIDTL
jgi:hypothetical protein